MLLPKNLFLKFLFTPIETNQKPKAAQLIRSYSLLQLIIEMTRVTNRIDMNELKMRFKNLKQKHEIRFNKDVVRQLHEISTKFELTAHNLMNLEHIS